MGQAPIYALRFDPNFPAVEVGEYHHAAEDGRILADIEKLADDFVQRRNQGLPYLRNPLFVTVYGDRYVVHPGKCRVKALKSLGITCAPALIYTPDKQNGQGAYGTPISPGDAARLFDGEMRCEYDARFFAVKRIGRGPGVIIYK